jgi:diguanylate cyclase (GGDEF)-like protein
VPTRPGAPRPGDGAGAARHDVVASPPHRTARTVRLARATCAALVVVVVAYGLTLLPGVRPGGPHVIPWLDYGCGSGSIVGSALLCLLRAVRTREQRAAWLLVGTAPLLYVAGNAVYYSWVVHLDDPPYPSWADACYLAVYPVLSLGLLLMLRGTLAGRGRLGLWLDGLTSGFGAAALLGAVVLRPVLGAPHGQLSLVLTNLAYPVLDLVLLAVVVLVFNLHGWRPARMWWYLGWAVTGLLVSDSVYLLQLSHGTYVNGGLLDVGWSTAFVALGPAAWSSRSAPPSSQPAGVSVVVPTALSVLSTVVLFTGAMRTMPVVVAAFSLLAVLVATLRLVLTLRESRRLVVAQREARTDQLTSLPNRRHFLEELRDAAATGRPLTVMLVDLDGFKQVNDSLGHSVGDALLSVIGERLSRQLQTQHVFVARLGGDEFAIVVRGADRAASLAVAARLRDAVQEPVDLGGMTLGIDASVGVAFGPDHGTTSETLMSRADAAMYAAKRNRTGVEVYSAARDAADLERLSLLADLRVALESRALDVHYQPILCMRDGSVSSVEALIRWPHPDLGLLAPAGFLPLLVEAGLSRDLTDLVLADAAAQVAAWRADGIDVPVSVNLFPADLADPELVARVAAACTRSEIPSELLHLEVTESVTAVAVQDAVPALAALRARGHLLLLDDFGTGYSSLSYLRDLPLDVVKLDRSFLASVEETSGRAVVAAAIQMARALGLEIVAEGVESQSVWDELQALGCDHAQGFHMARPAPAVELGDVVRHGWRTREPVAP